MSPFVPPPRCHLAADEELQQGAQEALVVGLMAGLQQAGGGQGGRWVLMGDNGGQWGPMGANGYQWGPMGANGGQWVPMGANAGQWV